MALFPGPSTLEGEVALGAFPGPGDGSTVWVFRVGGSLVRREQVHFRPGDFEYPMLLTGGRLVFADLSGAWLLDSDLVDGPQPLGEASYVVPGARPGLVWLAGDTWIAPLDVETGNVGTIFEVADDFWWAVAGVADGLIVIPVDEDTYGRTAYWTPTAGMRAIDLVHDAQSGALAAGENIAVVAVPGVIRVFDFVNNEYVSSFPIDLGEGPVSDGCLSPDRQYVAVVGSTGEAAVVDTSDGTVVQTLRDVSTSNGIGWTSSDQFVYLANLPGGTLLQAFNVPTGEIRAIASLESVSGWWLAAGGAMC